MVQPARQDELRQEFSGAWSLCDQTRRVPARVHLAAAEGPASRAAPPKADDGSCFWGGGAVTDLPGPAYVLLVSSHAEIPGSPTTCSEARALRPPSSTFGPDGRAGFGPHAGVWSGFGARSEGGFGPEMWRGGGRFGPHFEAESPRYGARSGSKNRPRNNMKRGGFGPERWLERAPSEAGQGPFGPHFGAESCYRPQAIQNRPRNKPEALLIDQHGVFTLAPPPPSSSSSSSSLLGPQACRF